MIWQTLIVDDERLARQKLRSLLADFSSIQIVAEADSVTEAVAQIQRTRPEIIFLDVQMPGATGFDLLERVETVAKIVFVTAYDEFAVRAFEVNALDYLLKPVSRQRLAQTVARLVEPASSKLPGPSLRYDDFVFVSSARASKFIRVAAIKCILAANIYSEIHTENDEVFLYSQSLNSWEDRLPANNFLRIHRSTIINLDFVERVEKVFPGGQRVYLRGVAEPLHISRRSQAKLKDRFS